MSADQRALLTRWLRYCEAHPDLWALPGSAGGIEIPLTPLDMTFDEVQELFDKPTLAEVRQAVEDWCADDAEAER